MIVDLICHDIETSNDGDGIELVMPHHFVDANAWISIVKGIESAGAVVAKWSPEQVVINKPGVIADFFVNFGFASGPELPSGFNPTQQTVADAG